jgi:hypothetical protein
VTIVNERRTDRSQGNMRRWRRGGNGRRWGRWGWRRCMWRRGGASGGVEDGGSRSMGGKSSRKERSVAVGGGVVALAKGNEFSSKMTW